MRFQPAVALPTTRTFTAGANQTIKVGDPVTLSNGKVVKATAASTSLLGVAASNVTTGAGQTAEILVWVGDDRTEFYGQCSGAPAATVVGATVDIEIDSTTGEPRVNEDASSTGHLLITGIHPKSKFDEAGAIVRFKINPAVALLTK